MSNQELRIMIKKLMKKKVWEILTFKLIIRPIMINKLRKKRRNHSLKQIKIVHQQNIIKLM